MGGLRVSNEVLLAKTETTYATDPTPTVGSNAILVRNASIASEGLRMDKRQAVRASLGQLQDVYGGKLARLTFEVEVKGSGSLGVAPEVGPLIEACGFDEAIVASTSATYTPESAAHESVTLWWYEGGKKKHVLNGCRGNMSIKLDAGGICVMSFEFVGHYTAPTDVSLPSPTYNSTVPRAAVGMAVAINGVTAIVAKSWEWHLNNALAMPPSIGAADGYGEIIITARDVRGSIEIESELASVIDLDTLLSAGTRFAFASGTLGSVNGNKFSLSTPSSSTYVTKADPAEGNGLRHRRVELAVDDSTANTELSLVFV